MKSIPKFATTQEARSQNSVYLSNYIKKRQKAKSTADLAKQNKGLAILLLNVPTFKLVRVKRRIYNS
jgi:hypothetical protein